MNRFSDAGSIPAASTTRLSLNAIRVLDSVFYFAFLLVLITNIYFVNVSQMKTPLKSEPPKVRTSMVFCY